MKPVLLNAVVLLLISFLLYSSCDKCELVCEDHYLLNEESCECVIDLVWQCNNGVLDGNEECIDCGGDCPCEIPCHCYNGVKDGNEEFIDCGGDCDECICTKDEWEEYCILLTNGSSKTWELVKSADRFDNEVDFLSLFWDGEGLPPSIQFLYVKEMILRVDHTCRLTPIAEMATASDSNYWYNHTTEHNQKMLKSRYYGDAEQGCWPDCSVYFGNLSGSLRKLTNDTLVLSNSYYETPFHGSYPITPDYPNYHGKYSSFIFVYHMNPGKFLPFIYHTYAVKQ